MRITVERGHLTSTDRKAIKEIITIQLSHHSNPFNNWVSTSNGIKCYKIEVVDIKENLLKVFIHRSEKDIKDCKKPDRAFFTVKY